MILQKILEIDVLIVVSVILIYIDVMELYQRLVVIFVINNKHRHEHVKQNVKVRIQVACTKAGICPY